MKQKLLLYLPGILLTLIAVVIGLCTYHDYGMSWDEPAYRGFGIEGYEYICGLKHTVSTNNLMGYELLLVFIEKWLRLTVPRDIYLMRHLVTHLLFVLSLLCAYVLIYRLWRKQYLAILGFVMLALMPRIYAHSFFNSRDVPLLSVFIIIFMVTQRAFDRQRPWLFFIAGLLCGCAVSIRIIGIMPAGIILLFLLIDWVKGAINKQPFAKAIFSMVLLGAGLCAVVCVAWPYDTVHNFFNSFVLSSRYNNWGGMVLLQGKFWPAADTPSTYLPVWFLITVPVLWIAAGFTGIVAIVIDGIKKPLVLLGNTKERNFLLYLLCFLLPVMSIVAFKAIVYDDWRHLYFIYPSFVLMGLYAIEKIAQTKLRWPLIAACVAQVSMLGWFVLGNHPHEQVYFNELVSHDKEYLQDNYEMDYWGCSYKQGLTYLLAHDPRPQISMAWAVDPLPNNILMLPEQDRQRIKMVDGEADYLITNFRDIAHGKYKELTPWYKITVQNSTIMCIYKLR